MNTAELDGQLLNYWTARIEGFAFTESWRFATDGISAMVGDGMTPLKAYNVVTNREGVTAIMDRAHIEAEFVGPASGKPGEPWVACVVLDVAPNERGQAGPKVRQHIHTGRTRGIAALRTYVAQWYGEKLPDLRV
jgi:hypothetical protein